MSFNWKVKFITFKVRYWLVGTYCSNIISVLYFIYFFFCCLFLWFNFTFSDILLLCYSLLCTYSWFSCIVIIKYYNYCFLFYVTRLASTAQKDYTAISLFPTNCYWFYNTKGKGLETMDSLLLWPCSLGSCSYPGEQWLKTEIPRWKMRNQVCGWDESNLKQRFIHKITKAW